MIVRQDRDGHGTAQACGCRCVATRRLLSGCVAIEAEHHRPVMQGGDLHQLLGRQFTTGLGDWAELPGRSGRYGGNRDRVGWKLIGFEDRMAYQPPFGYYDAHVDKEPK